MFKKILFLEDDKLFRRLIIPTLAKAGYEVVEAPKLKDAWTALNTHGETFDLYLVDGLLPDGKGETLIEYLRNARHSTAPIVFVSAYWKDFATFRRLTNELKVNFVLAKPISPQELCKHVDEAVAAYQKAQALEEERTALATLQPVQAGEMQTVPESAWVPAAEMVPETVPMPSIFPPSNEGDLAEAVVFDALPLEFPDEDPVIDGTVDDPSPPQAPPGPPSEDEDDDELEAYRENYRKALPQKFAAVLDAVQACEMGLKGNAQRHVPLKLAQRIARTAAAYGLLRESDAAGRIEMALRTEKPDWETVRGLIETALASSLSADTGEIPTANVAVSAIILAVHSNPNVLADFGRFGQSTLVHVVAAKDIAEASAAAAGLRLDGILLGIDHIDEYLNLQRDTAPWRGTPVAILAQKEDSDFTHRVAAEFTDAMQFITEPIDAAVFSQIVHFFLHSTWNQKPRVLIVSDDETFTDFIMARLQQVGIDGSALHTAAAIFKTLDVGQADFVLIDGEMLDVSPANLIRSIRMHPHWDTLPVAVLAARQSPAARLAAYRAGCDDYIDGQVARGELVTRIDARIVRGRQLRERFERDPLTGLLNSKAFSELFEALVGDNSNQPVCVGLIELHDFKSLNERHGRSTGDMMLSVLGHLLFRHGGAGAVCGRNDGASFSIAISGDCPDLKQKLETLAHDFARQRFHGNGGESFSAHINWGIATAPEDGTRSDALFRRAKTRLIAARKRG